MTQRYQHTRSEAPFSIGFLEMVSLIERHLPTGSEMTIRINRVQKSVELISASGRAIIPHDADEAMDAQVYSCLTVANGWLK